MDNKYCFVETRIKFEVNLDVFFPSTQVKLKGLEKMIYECRQFDDYKRDLTFLIDYLQDIRSEKFTEGQGYYKSYCEQREQYAELKYRLDSKKQPNGLSIKASQLKTLEKEFKASNRKLKKLKKEIEKYTAMIKKYDKNISYLILSLETRT